MFTVKDLPKLYADYIDQIVSEDFEKSQKLANGIISTIDNKLKENQC